MTRENKPDEDNEKFDLDNDNKEQNMSNDYAGPQDGTDSTGGTNEYASTPYGTNPSYRNRSTVSQRAAVQRLNDDGAVITCRTFRPDGVMKVSFRIGKLKGIAKIGRRGLCVTEFDRKDLKKPEVLASLIEALNQGGQDE